MGCQHLDPHTAFLQCVQKALPILDQLLLLLNRVHLHQSYMCRQPGHQPLCLSPPLHFHSTEGPVIIVLRPRSPRPPFPDVGRTRVDYADNSCSGWQLVAQCRRSTISAVGRGSYIDTQHGMHSVHVNDDHYTGRHHTTAHSLPGQPRLSHRMYKNVPPPRPIGLIWRGPCLAYSRPLYIYDSSLTICK